MIVHSDSFTPEKPVDGTQGLLLVFPSDSGKWSLDPECVILQSLLRVLDIPHRTAYHKQHAVSSSGFLPLFITKEGQYLSLYDALIKLAKSGDPDVEAFSCFLLKNLGDFITYYLWYDQEHFETAMLPIFNKHFDWPLNQLASSSVRLGKIALIRNKSLSDIESSAINALRAASELLNENKYLFGDWYGFSNSSPSKADCILFGYCHCILEQMSSDDRITFVLRQFPSILKFYKEFIRKYYLL